ncbi:MAG: TadE/TadG family type IV pilus assembly protein [Hyphomicrobiales bacterium]
MMLWECNLIEFGLLVPVLFLFLGAIYEGGIVMYTWGNMEHYGRQAARAMSIGQASKSEVKSYVKTYMKKTVGEPQVSVSVSETTGSDPLDNQVKVTVTLSTADLKEIMPLGIFGNINIKRTIRVFKET